jgi:spore maturation protein SpmA
MRNKGFAIFLQQWEAEPDSSVKMWALTVMVMEGTILTLRQQALLIKSTSRLYRPIVRKLLDMKAVKK